MVEKSLLLLSGRPIPISAGVEVKPLTLKEMMELGKGTYDYYVSLLTFDKSRLLSKGDIDLGALKDFTDYDILLRTFKDSASALNDFINALSTFLTCDVYSVIDNFEYPQVMLSYGDTEIEFNSLLYRRLREVIKEQNYISSSKEKSFRP